MNTQGLKCHSIYEVDFALIDVNLFLDTHSDSCEAAEFKRKLLEMRPEALAEYERKNGKLGMFSAEHCESPNMPWRIDREG